MKHNNYCNECFTQLSDCNEDEKQITEKNLISASIEINALKQHQTLRNMCEFTLERNLLSASIVVNVSVSHQLARNMSEFTQEKNLTSASIVINALEHHQIT